MALRLYGMRIAREDLQQVAGTRLRRVVGTMTGNRFKGAALGAGVTVLMQSSSATTVLLLGLVEADRLERDIRSFLTQMSESRLTDELTRRRLGLLYAVNDLESVGDILDKNLTELTLKKIHGRHTFSDEVWREVEGFHRRIEQLVERAVSALASGNVDLAAEVIEEHDQIADCEHELQLAHIGRLNEGTAETIDTSDIHIDVVSDLSRISAHARTLAQVVWVDLR